MAKSGFFNPDDTNDTYVEVAEIDVFEEYAADAQAAATAAEASATAAAASATAAAAGLAAEYLTKSSDPNLSAERVVTDNNAAGGIVADWSTAGDVKFKGYASGADKYWYSTGANAWAEAGITSAARGVLASSIISVSGMDISASSDVIINGTSTHKDGTTWSAFPNAGIAFPNSVGGIGALITYLSWPGYGADISLCTRDDTTGIVNQVAAISHSGNVGLYRNNDAGAMAVGVHRARGTPTARTAVQSGDGIFSIAEYGFDGSTDIYCGYNNCFVTGTVSVGNVPTGYAWGTMISGVLAERMRLTGANLGVGYTDPDAYVSAPVASFGDGAVGAPSIAHKGDLNTGMYFPSADAVGITIGGTQAVHIDSSQNFGIGKTSLAYKFSYQASSILGAIFDGPSSGAHYIQQYAYGGANFYIVNRAGGTQSSPSALLSDELIFRFGVRGYGATGWALNDRAAISFHAAENWSDSAHGTYITFSTTSKTTTTLTERVRIDDAGKVGVGISPTAKLHVNQGTAGVTALHVTGVGGGQFLVDYGGGSNNYYDAAYHFYRGPLGSGGTFLDVDGVIRIKSYTVGTLPAASTADGIVAFVTDATATTPRSVVAGGGANFVMVMSRSSNWLIVA